MDEWGKEQATRESNKTQHHLNNNLKHGSRGKSEREAEGFKTDRHYYNAKSGDAHHNPLPKSMCVRFAARVAQILLRSRSQPHPRVALFISQVMAMDSDSETAQLLSVCKHTP